MTRPALLATLALAACGDKDAHDDTHVHDHDDHEVTVQFAARLGGQDAACGQEVDGVGTSGSTVQLQDLRFYVSELALVDTAGEVHPITLDDDGAWQDGEVALVDFEDASGLCGNGTTPVRALVTGRGNNHAARALRFTLGVPFALNHADPAAAESPLNLTTMHWNWQGGYKFMRFDLSTTGAPEGWFVHLGSTGCEADQDGVVTACAQPNRVEVELEMDVATQTVVLDLDALLAGVDVDTNAGGAQGCMSSLDDPECGPILAAFGLSGSAQSVFFAE